ncbi:LysR substrate-binding domain-containing protein [Caulobacter mirabilis]|uniref:LysR family transcriptional regulator n=1 Tax=Caulobacter mirabilis TaxID=69666 RepID=A0A2D2B3I1_9CAUL|nr:LysR substrate-binding domain-containing protein [Caulobacter mirabilis]ATQ44756.1 LysR family transcriptional regulator [Caulobacter mirabilis]
MTDHLPPLSALRAFEAVVRLGSVSAAARELGRTHGAVSKQLRTLHDHAGLPLLERAGTGLKANTAGQALAAAIAEGLAVITRGYAETLRDVRAPELHVACSATFATRWLAPRLAGFSQQRPDLRLRLSMTSAREMREERDADLVILWDRGNYPPEDRARAIRLGDAAFAPVAAPGCLATVADGRLSAPCRIVHDHTHRAWDLWREATGITVESPRTLSFPHTNLCIEAAIAGLGVAMVEQRLAAKELADGRLVALTGFAAFPEGFAAIPNGRKPLSGSARHFIDWLAAELGPQAPP